MKENKTKQAMTTQKLAYCALLVALSVVLARLIIPMPNAATRFSIEAVPIFLAGMLFGPMAGGLVGFSADFIGCLFSGYGYNPLFCLPPHPLRRVCRSVPPLSDGKDQPAAAHHRLPAVGTAGLHRMAELCPSLRLQQQGQLPGQLPLLPGHSVHPVPGDSGAGCAGGLSADAKRRL